MDFNLQDKYEFRNMTFNERKAFLAYHEIKISDIAKRHKKTQPAVTAAIRGDKDLRKLLNRISMSLFKHINKSVMVS